jgi:CHAD domain-containing protein
MTKVKEEKGVIHIYLKETLTARHEKEKRKRGRPKEEIPDRNAVSKKTMEDLTSRNFLKEWDALSKVLQACGSYRKAEKWLREYCPSVPTSRKHMAEILKSHAKMKETARKRVREILEEARKNPYLTDEEL